MKVYELNCEVLEFKKILQFLAKKAHCDETKEIALKLLPSADIDFVRKLNLETDEATKIVQRFDFIEIFNLKSPISAIKRAKLNFLMTPAILLNICLILKQARIMKAFYVEHEKEINHLKSYFSNLSSNSNLEKLIEKSIISEELIADEASVGLQNVRNLIRKQKFLIKNVLDGIIKNKNNDFLQERIVTVKSGRFVVPVKSQNVKEIKGFAQDVSSSGSTVFIEPFEVVDLNNKLRVLFSQEKMEIEKILKNLTDKCLEFAEDILKDYSLIIDLDLIFAKASLAIAMNANMPIISNEREINLIEARHPLIDEKIVVPLNVKIGGKFKNMIISGPNTGGKTVALKTIGLLVLMNYVGLLIPASSKSVVSVFNKVLVLIGDMQSIEQSISTYSAHMKNIVKILQIADSNSLVLIDEICSGTDPDYGSALAVAIVEEISLKKVCYAISTHYTLLKMFAIKSEYAINASFEFNLNMHTPTYQLLRGIPGKSYAIEISKKIGLKDRIIFKAKKSISKQSQNFNELFGKLSNNNQILRKTIAKQFEIKKSLLKMKKALINEKEKFEKTIEKREKESQLRANELIQSIKIETVNLLNDLKQLRKQEKSIKLDLLTKETKAFIKNKIGALENEVNFLETGQKESSIKEQKIEIGDFVVAAGLNQEGIVLQNADCSGKILVDFGGFRARVDLKKLKQKRKQNKNKNKGSVKVKKQIISSAKRKITTEINLLGLNSEEAIVEIDKAIDGCVLSGIGCLKIIHGKGSGILRKAASTHLKKHPNVESFRLGVFGEGGDGVSIVLLK